MKLYCSTIVSETDAARVRELGLGVLFATTNSNFRPTKRIAQLLDGVPVCVDNGAFNCFREGYWFDEWAFLRTLNDVRRAGLKPHWIVAPDIVCGGLDSLAFSVHWARYRLPRAPLALAVQNGMTPEDIEPVKHLFRCIFVGGDLIWKWATAPLWIDAAHSWGLECHIGRAVDPADWQRAEELGSDSCDTSTLNRGNTGRGHGTWHRVGAFGSVRSQDIFNTELENA